MYQCDRKFWLENPSNLLCDFTVLPMDSMAPGSKLNAITRLALLLSLFLYLMDSRISGWFLGLALLCVVCLHYYQREAMKTVERFENARVDFSTNPVVANPVVAHFKDLTVDLASTSGSRYSSRSQAYSAPVQNARGVLLDLATKETNAGRRVDLLQQAMDYDLANTRSKGGFDQSCAWKPVAHGSAAYTSKFENLYKGSDPRTMVPPNITPRIFDWTAWDTGDLYQPSYVNTKRAFDMVGSGYLPQDDPGCGYITPKRELAADSDYKWDLVHQFPESTNHTYNYRNMTDFTRPQTIQERKLTLPNSYDSKKEDVEMSLGAAVKKVEAKEDFKMLSTGCTSCSSSSCSKGGDIVENFSPTNAPSAGTYQESSMNGRKGATTLDNYAVSTPTTTGAVFEGDLLGRCGYNRDNLLYNVPANTSVGTCDLRDSMAGYNDNLYSISVQPGVVYKSQIQLPISSNIGISYNQSLPITTQTTDLNGNTVLTNVDPRTFKVVDEAVSRGDEIHPEDIYDTRDTGYGPAYRGYVHELTGQPRYFYGDIDAAQKGQVNVFSNIDILQQADKRGFMVTNQEAMERAAGFQKYVDNEFLERTNNARVQLQQNFADKGRDPTVQRRRQPIMRTGGMTSRTFR